MAGDPYDRLVSLDPQHPVWERVYLPAPLAVIGTRDESGSFDLAPKHMVGPLGWDNYFGFVCAPSHATYHNAVREGSFTVSFPRPDSVLLASLTASPRCADGRKLALAELPTFTARWVEGIFLGDSHLFLECELDRVVDGFGANSLVCGKLIAAHVEEGALRAVDRDDQELLQANPLLVYLHPNRFARVTRSDGFPFPAGFSR